MTPVQMIVIVFFSAGTGWFISWFSVHQLLGSAGKKANITIRKKGGFPAWQQVLVTKLGKALQQEIASGELITDKLSSPLLLEKLKPEIEHHVDFFLNEKLATVFPLLYKFMGEKTLAQFKVAFLTETDMLFPVIIKKYMSELFNEGSIETIIAEKINSIPQKKMNSLILNAARKEINYFKGFCIVTGLLAGCISVIVAHFAGA